MIEEPLIGLLAANDQLEYVRTFVQRWRADMSETGLSVAITRLLKN
jgi:hypothetical protein